MKAFLVATLTLLTGLTALTSASAFAGVEKKLELACAIFKDGTKIADFTRVDSQSYVTHSGAYATYSGAAPITHGSRVGIISAAVIKDNSVDTKGNELGAFQYSIVATLNTETSKPLIVSADSHHGCCNSAILSRGGFSSEHLPVEESQYQLKCVPAR